MKVLEVKGEAERKVELYVLQQGNAVSPSFPLLFAVSIVSEYTLSICVFALTSEPGLNYGCV